MNRTDVTLPLYYHKRAVEIKVLHKVFSCLELRIQIRQTAWKEKIVLVRRVCGGKGTWSEREGQSIVFMNRTLYNKSRCLKISLLLCPQKEQKINKRELVWNWKNQNYIIRGSDNGYVYFDCCCFCIMDLLSWNMLWHENKCHAL